MSCARRRFRRFPLGPVAWGGGGPGCNEPGGPPPKPPCCEQPEIPPGVAPFTVVAEEVTGPSDGQKVLMRVALRKPIKRDEIYPVLHTLYRHAMTRGAFEPIHFVADLYPARGGQGRRRGHMAARIPREQSQMAPRCENQVAYDFGEQVDRAFAASLGRGRGEDVDDTCRLDKPKVKRASTTSSPTSPPTSSTTPTRRWRSPTPTWRWGRTNTCPS